MYVKLFASLYQGTLRGKPDEILVFTNLLAHADQNGVVDLHWRAISEETGLPQDRVMEAIKNLEAPDPESRSPEMNGSRIVKLDQHRAWGWHVVNYAKYRAIRNAEDRREQNRIAQQAYREKNKPPSAAVSQGKPRSAQAEEEALSISNKRLVPTALVETVVSTPPPDPVPYQEICNLYHEILPTLPRCLKLSPSRKANIRARWKEDLTELDSWRGYFGIVGKSKFLTGKINNNGRKPFLASLDWLCKQENILKVFEGKYD